MVRSAMLGMLATSNLDFGLVVVEICQTFARCSATGTWRVQNQMHKAFSTCIRTYLEEMNWFGSVMFGVIVPNNFDFGLAMRPESLKFTL
jgi:hypothetical protein